MKLIVTLGWILLGLEALLVGSLFLQKNMGDDAAGRGMATGFAIVLGPILLVAAALFIWGQRGGPRLAFWTGFGVMAIPLAFILLRQAGSLFDRLDRAQGRALYGKYADAKLTRLARAIEKDDTAAVRAMLAEGGIDFAARSRRGRTILGRAVEHAVGSYTAPEAVESVRMLLAAGATPIPSAIEPEYSQGDLDAHLLVAWVFGGNSSNTVPVLDLLLGAGADPNTPNYEGQPLAHSTYASLPKLEVLAKHGYDFTALDTSRTDRMKWTAAMTAANIQEWGLVGFFLDHGVPADYVAPDGQSLRTVMAEKEEEGVRGEGFDELKRRIESE